ncbi:MAG TPA: pitrilysin family protein [Rhodocyclaceae bacterium]|nr:pitrilysin family protein [Rhodocyclaceae bacterium]
MKNISRSVGRLFRPILSASLCLFALSFAATSAQAALRKITEVQGVTEYRLDNGLRILLAPDDAKPSTTVNLTYLVGSRHESYGETGMAHLLEHLVFKGTPTHPDIPAEFTRRGMRSNGTTSMDRTNYFETFAASDEALEWSLRMEADRMVNSFIARKDLDSEMTVVRNEMERGENNPGSALTQSVMSAAYRWHNYGKPTIGARADVENVGIENLQAFYRKYYQPDNAVLVVAGKFDAARTLGWIERYFGAIPKPARVLLPTYTVEPPQEGERTVQVARVGANRVLEVLYHVPPTMHGDAALLDIVSQIIGSVPGGRLHRVLVQSGKATAVGGWSPNSFEPGFMIFEADCRKEDDPAEVRKLLLQTIEGVAQQPITAEELQRAKRFRQTRWERSLEDLNAFGIGLSEYIAAGDWRLFFLRREQIANATLAEVNRVAQIYFKPYNRTVGELVPLDAAARIEVPGRADLGAALDGLGAKTEQTAGEAFDVSPANIEARTEKSRLANGLEMALLSKKTRGSSVRLEFNIRFGDAENLRGMNTVPALASSMLLKGSRDHDRPAVARELERLGSRVVTRQAGQSLIISVETRREQVAEVMKLLREILREPTFPADELTRLVRQRVANAQENALQPQTLANRALARHLTPYPADDIRYTQDESEYAATVQKIDRSVLAAFWRDYLGGDHAYVAAVGDFDAAELKRLMGEYFADWTSNKAYAALPEPWQDIAARVQLIETSDKQNANLYGGLRIPAGERHADYPAMLLATYLLGGGSGSSRLAARIRQKEGISYNVNASLVASSGSANSVLYISAIYAPQNRARLEAAVREELQRLYKDGFTSAELADARKGYLEARRLNRAQDENLAGQLVYNLRLKRSFMYAAELDTKFESLTLEELNAVVRRYFDPAKISLVFAGDFAQATRKQQ